MRRFSGRLNWSEELRNFVERRLRELEAEERLRHVVDELKRGSWSVPRGFSAQSVREDRDGN